MKNILWAVIAVLVVAGLGVAFWNYRPHIPDVSTAYQAVLLDNGQVYYGKPDHTDGEFSVFTDLYYIQSQTNPETKETKNVLIRRGNEWHAPNRTALATRHIILIEPVTPGSKVAQLIAELKAKNP
jgi:hypothetical protein